MEYSHPENDFDFIVLALHALMLESGFQLVKKAFLRALSDLIL
jgi:hypothetical protein